MKGLQAWSSKNSKWNSSSSPTAPDTAGSTQYGGCNRTCRVFLLCWFAWTALPNSTWSKLRMTYLPSANSTSTGRGEAKKLDLNFSC
eukprot:CAMPEP_0115377718 /NCGR_PEP_ID=MMETSP0271-20121206/3634_1 /TAXON_ID=71861 /ORGANISM="Scrippsiella trochoidea, Strain CCMP3099" /LENGTH=86 /DNA_ID=CAMNT_0002800845 /DNA_START=508 /DNA_END=768 /DNA_ORIENTATION=+